MTTKHRCHNCNQLCKEDEMIATPLCVWVCPSCFAEDPEFYGLDPELDDDDE